MKIKILSLIFTLLCIFIYSCTNEDDLKVPIKVDTNPPAALTAADVSYRPIAGGAVIKYSLPDEKDLRCVEAQYTITSGKKFTVRGSFLSDSLIVEGYRDTNAHDIKLYVVDNSENYSEPYTLSFVPNQSPLDAVLESLTVYPDFGGMQITWDNVDQSTIALFIYRIESPDTILIDQFYSKNAKGELTIRGEKSKKTEYLVQIRDRWNNYTDMNNFTITPLYEKELDYTKLTIPGSEYFINISNPSGMGKWWDGQKSAPGWGDIFWPAGDKPLPHVSTVKFPTPTTLSRIVLWQYAWGATNYSHFYYGANVRVLELYGSTEVNPSTEDPVNNPSWKYIMTCEIKMPSGGWVNNASMTEEDFDVAKNRGHEFVLPLSEVPVKYTYLRFRVTTTFDGANSGGMLSEVNLFGDDRLEGEEDED